MAIYFVVAIGAVLLVGLAVMLRRLVLNVGPAECDPAWIEKFSVSRYRPMLRLLSETDYEYLENCPSASGDVVRRLRAERRAIFRVYLKNLVRDFNRLHLAARVLALDSPVDRPDLAADLVRTRVAFERAVVAVQFRLLLHSVGLATVDASSLVGMLDKVSGECRLLVPAQAARTQF